MVGGSCRRRRLPVALHRIALVSAPLTDLQRAVRSVQHQILLAGALALIATLFAGYLASYIIARRLKRIERGALSIAAGDFSRPVPPGPPDEIGQLAVTFNMMGGRLREAFSQIEREKENVEVLLYDLAEGVIGVTAEGALAVANPAAATLLRRALPTGVALVDLLPPDVGQALVEVQADGENRTVVVEYAGRSLEASVFRVGGESEVRDIVVLRDITEQARLDAARRDFIATASHELKTPLFSLSGFMELIDEGDLDPDTEKEFLSLMRQQVDRLTDLSLSLLDLSQVDSGAVRLEAGDIDVTTLTRAVVAEFRPGAESRGVSIDVSAPAELPAACDERRLSQVLRALLDNAVKFSPHGGSVTVGLAAEPMPTRRRRRGDHGRRRGSGDPARRAPTGLRAFLSRQRRLAQVGHRPWPVDSEGDGRAHGRHADGRPRAAEKERPSRSACRASRARRNRCTLRAVSWPASSAASSGPPCCSSSWSCWASPT